MLTSDTEATKWNLRNHNCKYILLGVSHDAGYAPFLDEILRDESTIRRVAIIEGSPIVRELAATGCSRVVNFDHIFRNAKLTERQLSINQIQQQQKLQNQALGPIQPPTSGTHTSPTLTSWAGVTSTTLTTPPAMVFPVAVKNGAAAASAAAATLTITTPHPKLEEWYPGERGLDATLTITATVLERIKRRSGSNKLCNNHYLRGPCSKGDECGFEHSYKATDEDMKAIKYLARLSACTSGQECESEYCIYGHHCPSVGLNLAAVGGNGRGEEGVCAAFGCRFGKEGHPPGTVIKHPSRAGSYQLVF